MTAKRLWALLLVLCLLLTGCAAKKEAVAVKSDQSPFKGDDLNNFVQRVEYAMLAANLQMPGFAGYGDPSDHAYMGDMDGDGDLEFAYGYELLAFDITDSYNAQVAFSECGFLYYLDQQGNFWAYGVLGDVDNNETEWFESYTGWYQQWDGSVWNTVMVCDVENTYAYKDGVVADNPHTTEFYGEIDGKSVDKPQWDAHLESLNLTKVTTTSRDFTCVPMDRRYRDAIEEDLYDYLSTHHNTGSKVVFDADNDGLNETFIAVRNPFRLWVDSLEANPSYMDQKSWLDYDYESDYTMYIVSDPTGEEVLVSAYCVPGFKDVSQHSIYYQDGYLEINGEIVALSANYTAVRDMDETQMQTVYSYLLQDLESRGYICYGFKLADLSSSGNREIICICKEANIWYMQVYTLKNGMFSMVWETDLTNTACYLVMRNGLQYLLTYSQWVNVTSDLVNTLYSYELFRFDESYNQADEDIQAVSYTNNDQNAAEVSAFFGKFNQYFENATVIGDPFSLTGSQWGDSSDMDYGTPPQNTASSQSGRLGYVQIEDPESFLFLREGPGKEYDPVLMDPNNKDSYVRQAQGSPVTILEEIETGDPENPVWVKIRIHYGDREIIGYSSKRYIREAN